MGNINFISVSTNEKNLRVKNYYEYSVLKIKGNGVINKISSSGGLPEYAFIGFRTFNELKILKFINLQKKLDETLNLFFDGYVEIIIFSHKKIQSSYNLIISYEFLEVDNDYI